jgi:uncharacterized protein YecA (UPF0149 family)
VNERALKGLESVITETWFVGYLSGLAAANDKDFLKGTDNLSYHTEAMGNGLMIQNFNQSSKWMDVAPRTLDEKALKFVCSK